MAWSHESQTLQANFAATSREKLEAIKVYRQQMGVGMDQTQEALAGL